MNLNISAKLVAAVGHFRETADIRFYLNGVYVEPVPEGGVAVVATNGHCLAIWVDKTGEAERSAILVTGKPLLSACASKGMNRLQIVDERLTVIDKAGMELYVQKKANLKGSGWEINGKFPDWRSVIPDVGNDCSTVFEAYNPTYMGLIDKALRTGCDNAKFVSTSIRQPAQGKAMVFSSKQAPDFLGIVMPLREELSPIPLWAKKTPTESAP